jgi:hypothetical protein
MKNLCIVHPGTGTIISLSDEVYLFDYGMAERHVQAVANGEAADEEIEGWIADNADLGIRIDNVNIGRLFFGGAE